MAGPRKLRKTTIGGAFAGRLIEMLESPAHRALSYSALRVLFRLEVELGHHAGMDNGKLPCTYDDFARFGIDRDCIAPALREAQALGFIEWTPGAAGNAEHRRAGVFRLTYRPTNYGEPTHEWRQVTSDAEAKALAQTARKLKAVRHRPSKTKSQSGLIGVSSRENPDRNVESPVGEMPTTAIVGKLPLLSISREGTPLNSATPDAAHTSDRAARVNPAPTSQLLATRLMRQDYRDRPPAVFTDTGAADDAVPAPG